MTCVHASGVGAGEVRFEGGGHALVAGGDAVPVAGELRQALLALHRDQVLELHAGSEVGGVHCGDGVLERLVRELRERVVVVVAVHAGAVSASEAEKPQQHASRRVAVLYGSPAVV